MKNHFSKIVFLIIGLLVTRPQPCPQCFATTRQAWRLIKHMFVMASVACYLLLVTSMPVYANVLETNPVKKFNSLEKIKDFLPGLLQGIGGTIFVVALLIGGYRYLLSMGKSEETEKAKSTLIYALIGIIIVIVGASLAQWIVDSTK